MPFNKNQLEKFQDYPKIIKKKLSKTDRRVSIDPKDGSAKIKYIPQETDKIGRSEEVLGKEIAYAPAMHLGGIEDLDQIPVDPRNYEIAKKYNDTVLTDRLKEDRRKSEKTRAYFEQQKTKTIEQLEKQYGIIDSGEIYEMMENILDNLEQVLKSSLGEDIKLKQFLINRLDINAFVFGPDKLATDLDDAVTEIDEVPIFFFMGLVFNYQKYLRLKKIDAVISTIAETKAQRNQRLTGTPNPDQTYLSSNDDERDPIDESYRLFCFDNEFDQDELKEKLIAQDDYTDILNLPILTPDENDSQEVQAQKKAKRAKLESILQDDEFRLTEDKIAGIFAHEIGHLQQKWQEKSGISRALESSVKEKDADQKGMRLLNGAGYNPRALITTFNFLLAIQGSSLYNSMLQSHPPSDERRNDLIKLLDRDDQTFNNADKKEQGDLSNLQKTEYETSLYQGDLWVDRISNASDVMEVLDIIDEIDDPNELIVLLPYLSRIINTAELKHVIENTNTVPATILTRLLLKKRIRENQPRLLKKPFEKYMGQKLTLFSAEEKQTFFDLLMHSQEIIPNLQANDLDQGMKHLRKYKSDNEFFIFFESLPQDKQNQFLAFFRDQDFYSSRLHEILQAELKMLLQNDYALPDNTAQPYLEAPNANIQYNTNTVALLNSDFRYEDSAQRPSSEYIPQLAVVLDLTGDHGGLHYPCSSQSDIGEGFRTILQKYEQAIITPEERELINNVSLSDFASGNLSAELTALIPEAEEYLESVSTKVLNSRRSYEKTVKDTRAQVARSERNEYYDPRIDPVPTVQYPDERTKQTNNAEGIKQYLTDQALINSGATDDGLLPREYENAEFVQTVKSKLKSLLSERYLSDLQPEDEEIREPLERFIKFLVNHDFDTFLKPNETLTEQKQFHTLVNIPPKALDKVVDILCDQSLLDLNNLPKGGVDKKRQRFNSLWEYKNKKGVNRAKLLSEAMQVLEATSHNYLEDQEFILSDESIEKILNILPTEENKSKRSYIDWMSQEFFIAHLLKNTDTYDFVKEVVNGNKEYCDKLMRHPDIASYCLDEISKVRLSVSGNEPKRKKLPKEEQLKLYAMAILAQEGNKDALNKILDTLFDADAISFPEKAELIRRIAPSQYKNFVGKFSYEYKARWMFRLNSAEALERALEHLDYIDNTRYIFEKLYISTLSDDLKAKIDELYNEIEDTYASEYPEIDEMFVQNAENYHLNNTRTSVSTPNIRNEHEYYNKLYKIILSRKKFTSLAEITTQAFNTGYPVHFSTLKFARDKYLQDRGDHKKEHTLLQQKFARDHFEIDEDKIGLINFLDFIEQYDRTHKKRVFKALMADHNHFMSPDTIALRMAQAFNLDLDDNEKQAWYGSFLRDLNPDNASPEIQEFSEAFTEFCQNLTIDDINSFLEAHKDTYKPGFNDFRFIEMFALAFYLKDRTLCDYPELFPQDGWPHKETMMDEDISTGTRHGYSESADAKARKRRPKADEMLENGTAYDISEIELFYKKEGVGELLCIERFREQEEYYYSPEATAFEQKINDLKTIIPEKTKLYSFVLKNIFHVHLYALAGINPEEHRKEINLERLELEDAHDLFYGQWDHAGANILITEYTICNLDIEEILKITPSMENLEQMYNMLQIYSAESEANREYYSRIVFQLYLNAHPDFYEDFDSGLDVILEFFPESSPFRDALLNQLLLKGTFHYEHYAQLNKYFYVESKESEGETESETAITSKEKFLDKVRNKIRGLDRQEKVKTVFWLLDFDYYKPKWLDENEIKFLASFESWKQGFWAATGQERYELIYDFMLSEQGIFRDDIGEKEENIKILMNFVNNLFQGMKEKNNITFEVHHEGAGINYSASRDFERLSQAIFVKTFKLYSPERRARLFTTLIEALARHKADEESEGMSAGEMIGIFLSNAGILGIKIGQILSEREEVPENVRNELADFKDHAPAFSKKIVFDYAKKHNLIEEEIGTRTDKPLRAINGALNFASIKGVFDCDYEGEISILKFKRPTIDKYYQEDKVVLKQLVAELEQEGFPVLAAVIDEAIEVCEMELDFLQEAENHKTLLANNLARSPEYNGWKLKVPNIYFSTEEMIIEQKAKGLNFSAIYKARSETGANRRTAMEKIAGQLAIQYDGMTIAHTQELLEKIDLNVIKEAVGEDFFVELLDDGAFHSDLHKGNIIIDPVEHTIDLIDCGSMGIETNTPAIKSLISSIHFGFVENTAEIITEHFIQELNQGDDERIIEAVREVFEGAKDIEQKIRDLYWKLLDLKIKTNKGFKMMLKGLVSGYPNFGENINEVFQSYLDNTDIAQIAQNTYEQQDGNTIDKVLSTVSTLRSEVSGTNSANLEQMMGEHFEVFRFLQQKLEAISMEEIKEISVNLDGFLDKIAKFAQEQNLSEQILGYLNQHEEQIVDYLVEKINPRVKFIYRFFIRRKLITKLKKRLKG